MPWSNSANSEKTGIPEMRVDILPAKTKVGEGGSYLENAKGRAALLQADSRTDYTDRYKR